MRSKEWTARCRKPDFDQFSAIIVKVVDQQPKLVYILIHYSQTWSETICSICSRRGL
ncbi:hypothetical protein BN2476_180003 [Paraburkholderia piptadeniae]|uniref:Transposase n=1 Tax=Paraburkholderia piptadeniae TaxID=1701573 RepID=A0A1N7RUA8_9BURK|nr:hypothetical protein BN2476_180003 [Paraburkholderia piptadeniae]